LLRLGRLGKVVRMPWAKIFTPGRVSLSATAVSLSWPA
jgi:hypothetical protein